MNSARRLVAFLSVILFAFFTLGWPVMPQPALAAPALPPVGSSPAAPALLPLAQEGTPGSPTLLQSFALSFGRDRVANSLAVLILVALLLSLVLSLVAGLRPAPVDTHLGWYTPMLLLFSLLGMLPMLDLLQTSGLALLLALVASTAILLNALAAVQIIARRDFSPLLRDWYRWATPLLVVGGIAVASYLTFVEATRGTPICGPTGDCATVQHSPYARLFGVLPVGVLGLAGYLGILAAWWLAYSGPEGLREYAALAGWGMCLFGVLFSAYLTFLEPFVIGASCMWCLTSAMLMILLLWVATPAAQRALNPPEVDEE